MAETVDESFPSKFLKAEDLKGNQLPVTVVAVQDEEITSGKIKPVMYCQEVIKGIVLCKTNARKLAVVFGTGKYADWKGKTALMYSALVPYQGSEVPAIRFKRLGE